MLNAGIVGLPNVGKSTLFNALTRTRKAEAANYPFCTIDPNVGVVQVPDARLAILAEIAKTSTIIPAAIEFVDIAGLVAGASKGEGLGNKFLANIREVDAIVQVVRCFEDEDIIHNMGSVDPLRDIDIINTELILADLESAEGQLHKVQKKARGLDDKEAKIDLALLEKIIPVLNENKPAVSIDYTDQEKARLKHFNMLTSKPILYACNVKEDNLLDADDNPHVQAVRQHIKDLGASGSCIISARLEEDLIDLSEEDAKEFLNEMGVEDSGVSTLIRASYDLLGLASYFTAGEKEARAWTFRDGMKAPECAGVIHTDFETGFIKAEVVSYPHLVEAGSVQAAREAGKYRLEGKEYQFKDGDVALFRFNN